MITREISIHQIIIIEIAQSHATAIVDVFKIKNIHRVHFRDMIGESDTRFLGGEFGKQRIITTRKQGGSTKYGYN